jgi:DNA polymerase-3 subunit delta'
MNRGLALALKALSGGRPHSTFLFHGDEGVGKAHSTEIFAATVLGKNLDRSLERVRARVHPDLLWISTTERTLKVDEVRGLARSLSYPPFQADKRVVVIQFAERMTSAAQNSILKILEEPPSYAVFILLASDSSLILPTIRSRSQMVRFPQLTNEELLRILDEKASDANPELRAEALRWGEGSATRTLRYLSDQEYRDSIFEARRAFWQAFGAKRGAPRSALTFAESVKGIEEASRALSVWTVEARDLAKALQSTRFPVGLAASNWAREQAGDPLAGRRVFAFIDDIYRAEREISQNVSPKMVFASLFSAIRPQAL